MSGGACAVVEGACIGARRPVAEALMSLLAEIGSCGVGVRAPYEPRKLSRLGFQYVGVEVLVREYVVGRRVFTGRRVFECDGYSIVGGRGDHIVNYTVSRPGVAEEAFSWSLLRERVGERFPVFVVDLSFLGVHSEEELSSLRLQLAMSLSVVREYLWDEHLALSSAPKNIREWLYPVMGRNKVLISETKPGEMLWSLSADKVIILRPDAEKELSRDEVLSANAFLIGGIVDKIPRPGLSRVLDALVPWGEPRRISLRGSIIGVPSRLHRIIGSILAARLDYGGDLERGIVSFMAKSDRINRIFYELSRSRRRRFRMSELRERFSWLGAVDDEILLAARKARVEVVDVEG